LTIWPRGLFITLLKPVMAAVSAATRAAVTPRPAAPASLTVAAPI
jgi:hypothetical protein